MDHPMIKEIDAINAVIDIHPSSIGFVVDFRIQYRATFSCVRCLELFTSVSNANLILTYVEGIDPHASTENIDLTKSDIDKTYYTGSHLDLKIGIREAIILSLPIAPLCKGDCAGLCPQCGINKNKISCSCVVEETGVFTPKKFVKREYRKKHRKRTTGKRVR